MGTKRFTTPELTGRTLYCSDGDKLGTVEGVLEDETGTPRYLEVTSGWFGTRRHAVPMHDLMLRDDGDDLVVPYTKEQMKNAPTLDERDDMTYDRERDMGAHYGTEVRDWDDVRDHWLPEEDLSRGPTPQTRHPQGGRDLETDTTQGPTPEVRDAMRAGDHDPGAAGQPEVDPRTRQRVGRDADVARDDLRMRDERDLRREPPPPPPDLAARDDARMRDDAGCATTSACTRRRPRPRRRTSRGATTCA